MRAILTTIGKDKTGIIAGVSSYLAQNDINIVDVSQTIMDGYFTMMMMVDVDDDAADFEKLTQELDALGTKLGVDINIRNQEMYDAIGGLFWKLKRLWKRFAWSLRKNLICERLRWGSRCLIVSTATVIGPVKKFTTRLRKRPRIWCELARKSKLNSEFQLPTSVSR